VAYILLKADKLKVHFVQ